MWKLVLVVTVALVGTAIASQEQTHRWKTVTIVAETNLFGDVDVKTSADATGIVQALEVTAKGATITVPKAWLGKLPAVKLASIEVRSERGYDPQPWALRRVPSAVGRERRAARQLPERQARRRLDGHRDVGHGVEAHADRCAVAAGPTRAPAGTFPRTIAGIASLLLVARATVDKVRA